MDLGRKILSDIIVYTKYAKHLPDLNRRETWHEVVDRNKAMHIRKFPFLADEIDSAYALVYSQKVLPSMRSAQFAGKAAEINNARMYNCAATSTDHPDSFHEIAFLLLSGCGVGVSVQRSHVKKLPAITIPTKEKRFVIQDSIIGWADAIKALMRAYFYNKPRPKFDFSEIRAKGLPLKTSGGIAPGPEPLKDCLHNIQKILDRKQTGEKLLPLDVYDIVCFIGDCVLAGGVRRAALLFLFSLDDEQTLTAKYGEWWKLNPQRARGNNSASLMRHRIRKPEFMDLWSKIEASRSGEPGFMFSNDRDFATNPCGEVALRVGASVGQMCNLTSINSSDVADQSDLNARARAAAFIATLQASYTNFHYLREEWQQTTEKEALIGVSMTGITSGKVLTLNLTEAAEIVKTENERVAKLIGINKAARCTVVKPEGTVSAMLGTSSGIHATHAPFYIRRMRLNKEESLYKYLVRACPAIVEDDVLKPNTDALIAIPHKVEGGTYRDEGAINFLNRVAKVYEEWIVPGHRKGANTNNVSATVSVGNEEWAEVGEWMWKNRDKYTAISVLPLDLGTYVQAPFEEITEEEYEDRIKHLRHIDLTKVVETEDTTNRQGELACAGGACEITF